MKSFRNLLLVFFCFFLLVSGKNFAQTFQQELENVAQANNLVGMSVIAMCNGQMIDSYHYGLSDIDRNIIASDQTYYRIASISKTVTATALMVLYDEGWFQLNDNINSYLDFDISNPNYPNSEITFSMLLSHTSGLSDGSGYQQFLGDTYNQTTPPHISELLQQSGGYFTSNMWLNIKPGNYFNYSNINYGVIATLIEQISGVRFDEFVKNRILEPLGISGSFNIDDIDDIGQVAVLYRNAVAQADNYQGVAPEPFDADAYTVGTNGVVFAPQGGLRITTPDLLKFMALHANNGTYEQVQVLSAPTAQLMHSPVWTYDGTNGNNYYNLFNSWGLGLHLTTGRPMGDIVFNDVPMIGHPGEAYGLISDMYFEKEKQFGFIFLTNGYYAGGYEYGDQSAFYGIEEQVFDIIDDFFWNSCKPVGNILLQRTSAVSFYYYRHSHSLHFNNAPDGQLIIVNSIGETVLQQNVSQQCFSLPKQLSGGVYVVKYLCSSGEEYAESFVF